MAINIKYIQEEQEPKWIDHERFLDQYLQRPQSEERFAEIMQLGLRRFPLNLDELRRENTQLVQDLIKRPTQLLRRMYETLERMRDKNMEHNGLNVKKQISFPQKTPTYRISFEGNLGRNFVTPRGITAALVNNLVSVQGIVTRMSSVRPKLLESYHYTDQTKKGDRRIYWDSTDPAEETNLNPLTVVPKRDQEDNPMIMEFGYSVFRDTQQILIQELPERTPTGQLPRSIEVIFEDDLIDQAKPGDRIIVTGIYKCFSNTATRIDGSFRSALLATNVQKIQQDTIEDVITDEDLKNIKEISKMPNVIKFISKSIAPSIQGHDKIKEAVLLLLVGGSEKNLSTGTHLRGDINMLLIGDPSTGKSQVLRYIMNVAPLAINTTGRGTSSVGLTASVRRDPDTNENILEAGAMVLADGGVVLIDEFDKMNEIDRVAIHEVMEQQTVTIAKAGIHCTLNARCSVVAAANPIFGEYQRDLLPTKNIGLPDSLLSRFDLLFVVLDEKTEDKDRKVAEKVTKNHRYRGPNDLTGQTNVLETNFVTKEIKVKQEHSPYEKNTEYGDSKDLRLTQSFLKKYIMYTRQTIKLTRLDDESVEEISKKWVEMRQEELTSRAQVRILPITIRSLESLIRLASAHAKLRLSNIVTKEDCDVAYNLMKSSLWGDESSDQFYPDDKDDEDKGQNKNQMQEEVLPSIQEEREEKQQKKQTRSSKQKDSQESVQKIKKLKIDEDDEIKQVFKMEMLGSIQVNDKQRLEVYNQIYKIQQDQGNEKVSIDSIWEHLQRKSDRKVKTSEELQKSIMDLEAKGKLYIDASQKIVQLI